MNEVVKEVHFDGKVALKAIIEREGKVLIMRDVREEKEIWEIPGGRLNEGEVLKDALAREIKEELGIGVEVGAVVHMQQFFQSNEGRNALMIACEATMKDKDQKLVLEEREVAEVRWISREEYAQLRYFPEYKTALEIYFKNKPQ